MRAKILICVGCLLCSIIVLTANADAGRVRLRKIAPPIDVALTSFKKQGVWYFFCDAPVFPIRILPNPLTFGPPPPCAPSMMPMGPAEIAPMSLNSPSPMTPDQANPLLVPFDAQTMR